MLFTEGKQQVIFKDVITTKGILNVGIFLKVETFNKTSILKTLELKGVPPKPVSSFYSNEPCYYILIIHVTLCQKFYSNQVFINVIKWKHQKVFNFVKNVLLPFE